MLAAGWLRGVVCRRRHSDIGFGATGHRQYISRLSSEDMSRWLYTGAQRQHISSEGTGRSELSTSASC